MLHSKNVLNEGFQWWKCKYALGGGGGGWRRGARDDQLLEQSWHSFSCQDWTRGYGEVTPVVCIDNPPTTNERLTSPPSVARNSPSDTFITAPVLQFYITAVSTSPPRGTNIIRLDEADKGNGWNNSCCSFLASAILLSFFHPSLSHDSPPPAPSNKALILTGQAAVQPRVENGNANPPGGCCVNFSDAPVLSFSPSGRQVQRVTQSSSQGPMTRRPLRPVLILKPLMLFDFGSPERGDFNL